jgi:hypothetical protein
VKPQILVSYHYFRTVDLAALVDRVPGGVDLFADSGAYSAYTTGAVIKPGEYAAWLRDWDGLFTTAANLDVVGDHAASRRNLHEMERRGCHVFPVFHGGEPWDELAALCRTYPYIALGGLAGGRPSRRAIGAWLLRCLRVGGEHGARFHAFGITAPGLLNRMPLYSVDSSTFTMSIRCPLVTLWDERRMRLTRVYYRRREDVARHAALLRAYDLPAHRVLQPDFRRYGEASDDRVKLVVAAARSFAAWGQYLVRRHRVTPPRDLPPAELGTKLYLAVGPDEWKYAVAGSLPVTPCPPQEVEVS